jgi:hypothetical protein
VVLIDQPAQEQLREIHMQDASVALRGSSAHRLGYQCLSNACWICNPGINSILKRLEII